MYASGDNITYFDIYGVEHILKELEKFISNKNIATNNYRIQANDSTMCGYFCITFIDLILRGESLLDYTKLFSFNKYEKNDETILKYFQ